MWHATIITCVTPYFSGVTLLLQPIKDLQLAGVERQTDGKLCSLFSCMYMYVWLCS